MTRFAPHIHPPKLITRIYPKALWRFPQGDNAVYLTFDDGPVPEATPWILDLLEKENVKATFFCVGENVVKHPFLYAQILEQGHSVGNHTFNHLQGLRTANGIYLDNIEKAAQYIDSSLFRPPHGLMTPMQYKALVTKYKIVMWDVISGDINPNSTSRDIIGNISDFVTDGSIITFHDSIRTISNLRKILHRTIKALKDSGFHLKPIPFSPAGKARWKPEKNVRKYIRAS